MCDVSNTSEVNEILEAFKYLNSSQIGYFKKLIVPEDTEMWNEEYMETIKSRLLSSAGACPSCGSAHVVKNGRSSAKRQRYKCKDCKRIFSSFTNTPLAYSKKSVQHWLEYMECMTRAMSIRDSAEEVGIHPNTSFQWRHKILNALKSVLKDNLCGIVEIDETMVIESFKGNHSKDEDFHMRRKPRERGVKPSERASVDRVRVLCCLDRVDNIFSQVAGRIRPDTERLISMLQDKIETGSTICTNNNMAYKFFAKKLNLKLYKMKNFQEVRGEVYHYQGARSFGRQLKSFLIGFNGVATKYLNFYITWLKWMCLSKGKIENMKAMTMLMLVSLSRERLRVCDFKLVNSMP